MLAHFDAGERFALAHAGLFCPDGHFGNAVFERNVRNEVAERFPDFFVRRVGVHHFIAGVEVFGLRFRAHRPGHDARQFRDRTDLVRADVEHLIVARRSCAMLAAITGATSSM